MSCLVMEARKRKMITRKKQEEVEEEVWIESIDDNDKFSLIDVNSFIAIRSETKSTESFHLMQVTEKLKATANIQDSSGEYAILKEEPYVVCKWFSFQKETKKFAWFSQQADNVDEALKL